MSMQPDAERQRLKNQQYHAENWRLWGPYLSERAWGTVREDYSEGGSAWGYFDHDRPTRARTAGAKMVSAASRTRRSGSVSGWRYGMAAILF